MYYDLRAHPSVEAKLTEMNYKVALETKIIKGVTKEKELTRITIILNTQQCFKNTDSYDLVAVQPQDEKMFALACKQLDVDIISFDFTQRLDYHFKLPNVNSAISRGICFEICYADALKNQSGLGNFLEGATALIRATKGKNVIISSNANSLMVISIDIGSARKH
jgi:ribonuclease P/MRP protein subunit RPP1